MSFFSKQGRTERRKARHQRRFEARVAPILEQSEIAAQMMVMITDQEVRQNRPLRTDDELRRDFAAEPEEIARMLAYHVHGLDLMRASAEWAANPMTSRVDAEMERKIGVLRAILAKGGPDL